MDACAQAALHESRYDCVVVITASPQEQFTHKCRLKLEHPKKPPHVNMSHLVKMHYSKGKTVLLSQKSKLEILFGKHGH